jgi:alpha-L-fucosidase
MATFYQLEWANGYEDPLRFSPAKLDCTQWADAAVEVGMKYAVLAAKHNGAW